MKRRTLLIITLVCLLLTGHAFSSDVTDLSGKKYFPAVKEAIDNAEKSIFMVVYIVNFDERDTKSPVYKLCESLVEARKRGVQVKIILDQNIDFGKHRENGKWQVEGKNEDAFNFFKQNNIDVSYDEKTTYTHSKAIVIDDEIVIMGSTNWSDSALRRNNETSVLIKSKKLAKSLLKNFFNIAIDYEASKSIQERASPLAIHRYFMEAPNLAGKMMTSHDERAFDVYLLLLKDNFAESEFNYNKIALQLGLDKKMSVNDYRRQLSKTLRKLESEYNLIEFNPQWGKNAQVKLLNKDGTLYEYPQGKYFLLPGEYFTYGWDKKLSLAAKYCYVINLYKSSLSKDKPWWFGSRETLGLKFHIQRDTVTKGMAELRRLNLIDVEYSDIEEGYENREPAKYKPLNLYCPEQQTQKWERLEKLYGKDRVKEARKLAEIVFEENAPTIIEDIILLTDEHGKEQVQKAFDIVSQKAIDNPKRTYKYVMGILKNTATTN